MTTVSILEPGTKEFAERIFLNFFDITESCQHKDSAS